MPSDDISPIRKQYLEIKRQYPDAILFFRLGDFYETFDQDAEITSRELDIVLTSRNVAKGVRIPMAGIPHHAAENYLSRLIERGFHVAICEQVGEQPLKGLFPRQVTRVVTPGTVVEPGMLTPATNNYLAAALIESETDGLGKAGIAYVDITTGEFSTTELNGSNIETILKAELDRLQPAEILVPETLTLSNKINGHLTTLPVWRFEAGRCRDLILRHFKVGSLDGFGLRGMPLAVSAAGVILQYLEQTQPAALNLLTDLSTYSTSEFMVLDSATRRNLELTETIRGGETRGSLLWVLDHTITPMGKRLLRQWVSKPRLDVYVIHDRQSGVWFFYENGLHRGELRAALKPLGDLERLVNRVLGFTATPRDLVAIRETLHRLPGILSILRRENNTENSEVFLDPYFDSLQPCNEEIDLLDRALADDPPATLQNVGVMRPGFSSELDAVVERSRNAREWIANLESSERERTGIRSLKVGYNKVFGYFIEVTHANTSEVPAEYIRKQTLVNAERYITPEMKEYETLVLNAEERIREIESRLFKEICSQLAASNEKLIRVAHAIAELDVLSALAEAAVQGGYTCPEVVEEDVLKIIDGRHPVVEMLLSGERFVPNNVVFEEGERIRIITGPNMSGKSTLIRQTALIVLMAQLGSFVPAAAATIGLVDRIFTRIGAQDEIFAGQSTFMVEMVETANILHHATSRSLLILDEIGRGTSTYDGVAIAWAVVEYIHNHPRLRSKTLFATHYHELSQLAELLPGVRNYNVAVSEADGQVVFLHKIVPGGADRSYGIHVGQLAGLPQPVVQRATEIIRLLEASSGKAVKIDPQTARQLALFPETNPLLDELRQIDVNALSPIEALNKLFEWQRKFSDKEKS